MPHPSAHIYLGGSFDPVHTAHTFMAKRIYEQLTTLAAPHHIHFLPTAGSPLKNTQTTTKDRLAMLTLALADTPFYLDARETKKPAPVYTIDTLTELRSELGYDTPIIFVLGLDSLADLPKWKDGDKLLDFCHFWLFDRSQDGQSHANAQNTLENMTKCVAQHPFDLKNRLADRIETLLTHSNGYLFLDAAKPAPISSTQIRCHINDAKDLLNSSVWEYIKNHSLYQNGQ